HFGAAQEVVERNAAVLEHDHGGVGCADAELVLDLGDGHARRAAFHDERFDAAPSSRLVDGGPYDHEAVGFLCRHLPAVDEDLRAVEPPMIAAAHRSGGDGGGI